MHTPTPDAMLPNGKRAFTSTQRQTLAAWLGALHERDERHDFPLALARTLAGDKPACLIQTADFALDAGPFEAVAEALSFVHELGLLTMQPQADGPWCAARTRFRLELLPSPGGSNVKAARQRRLGAFFGYPEPDVEWFIETPTHERAGPRERVKTGAFTPAEVAHVDLLPYVHETSIDGYERAIAAGTQIRQRIDALAERWELPVLNEMAEDHYDLSRRVYAGEREYFPGEFIGFKLTCKNPALD